MTTTKNRKIKALKYKNFSKKKRYTRKNRKSRAQKGCNRRLLTGGANTSNKKLTPYQQKKIREAQIKHRLSKTIFIDPKSKRSPVQYNGREKRKNKSLTIHLEEKKKRDCQLRRNSPTLILNPRNLSLRQPLRHIIGKCHSY
jgi:hypothetical protein